MRHSSLSGLVWWLGLLAGCDTQGLAPFDGLAGADLAGGSCGELAAEVQAQIDANASCRVNTDCMVASTACGLPGQCGAFIARTGYDPLEERVRVWQLAGCGTTAACPPCAPVIDANCIAGHCAAAPPPNVGAACTDSAQCGSVGQYAGMCLDSPKQPQFTNGYCALPCAHGFGCPWSGLLCRQIAGTTAYACFASCQSDGDCRAADGYRCCPVSGINLAMGKTCYPGPCP
jgi:hypothetical protein